MEGKMREALREFLSEENGLLSFMRLAIFLILIVYLFNWTWHNLTTEGFTPMSWSDMATLVGLMAMKAVQKKAEK
jgi:hypothetical protein